MKVTAPGMPDMEISIPALYVTSHSTIVRTKIWKDTAECIDCGDEAGRWISKFILNKPDGLRLVFYPSSAPKPDIQDRNYAFKQADDADTGTLHGEFLSCKFKFVHVLPLFVFIKTRPAICS